MKHAVVGLALIGAVAAYALQPESRPIAPTVASAGRVARQRFEAAQRELRASGASSCNSPTCHGGATPQPGEFFLGDEYDRWYARGLGNHFRAYKTLYEDERSDRMAKILYGPNAVAKDTPQCRACHALDVPKELQGRSFYIEDGVTCESCHGRSEKWSGPHQYKNWRSDKTPEQRQADGFDDLRDVVRRAEKCLECHAGTDEKRVTHAMMAAGHPPLTLDLAGDLYDVPKHWKDEQSFISEKEGSWFHARVWAVGQAVALRESMRHLAAWAASDQPPDLAIFECYACHHELDESKSWRQQRNFPKVTGYPAWDASTAILCRPLVDMFLSDSKAVFTARLSFLRESLSIHGTERSAVRSAAEEMELLADQLAAKIARTEFGFEQTMRIMQKIVDHRGEISSQGYRAAEQAFDAFFSLYRLAVAESDKKPANHEDILKCLVELENALYSAGGTPEKPEKRSVPERYDPFRILEILDRLTTQLGC